MNVALAAALSGFALGWSVAWPPGPVNAEIARRGATRGFASAFAVGLGASSGDFLWAIAMGLGAGALAGSSVLAKALSALSIALLMALAVHYLVGAARHWRRMRRGERIVPPAFDSARGGYLLGLAMALTSPFNIAFWLAVIGRPEVAGRGVGLVLITALSVIAGALTWVATLSGGVVLLRARYDAPWWDVVTHVATGLLLGALAVRSMSRFLGA
jgi:threonine/homoserine/homoserine lactone efflux protein